MSPGSPNLPKRQWRGRRYRRDYLLALGFSCMACQRQPPVTQDGAAPKVASIATPPSQQTQPLTADPPAHPSSPTVTGIGTAGSPDPEPLAAGIWSELAVEGYEPAVLWYQKSAPLWVISHGAGGHAEWHCEHFHRLLAGRATLLCPRGKQRFSHHPSAGYYYPDHWALQREVLAAIAKYESMVGPTRPYLYAGYSQGATMGALAFANAGGIFDRLLLVEGGYADWSPMLVRQYQQSGGKAMLWICGTGACNRQARAAAQRFKGSPVETRVHLADGAGHRPDGAVGQATSQNLPFLLQMDARWQGFTPNPEDNSAPRGE